MSTDSATATLSISPRKVRQINDPILQFLNQLHKIVYITQVSLIVLDSPFVAARRETFTGRNFHVICVFAQIRKSFIRRRSLKCEIRESLFSRNFLKYVIIKCGYSPSYYFV